MCVQARGKEDAHPRDRSRHSEGGSLAKVSLDYQELKSKANGKPNKDYKILKIIVMKDQPSGSMVAYRVDTKGPGDTWIVKRLV